jgi:hydrogenase maturation protein HypF
VQVVGFRPFVYRLAHRFALTGNLRNSESGVQIEVQGPGHNIADFLVAISSEAPPLAQLLGIETASIPLAHDSAFTILQSTRSGTAASVWFNSSSLRIKPESFASTVVSFRS